MEKYNKFHPLLVGAGFRLAIATLVTSGLWIGFLLAISPPGVQ